MGRPHKLIAALGLPPLRDYWRAINRAERQADAQVRAERKSKDRKRRKCKCEAYPWPHRPGGGLCRWPDPPLERYQRKPGGRPYRKRYAGILRQIARNNGLHPIRDRELIEALLPRVMQSAKTINRQTPRAKYRNMEIVEADENRVVVRGVWTSAGPTM